MNKRVTIKDIAKVLGCSANCVSRALMDAPDISQATKEKIRKTAEEMGYVYHGEAASMRNGKSRTIGIILDNLLNPFYYIMTNYIWNDLQSVGYNFITFKNDDPIFGADMVKRMVSLNIDGILSFLQPSEEANAIIERTQTPIVVLGRKTHGLCDCVYLDDERGGALAAEYFLKLGCKKPLYLSDSKKIDCSLERGEGFYKTFKGAGIEAKLEYLECYGLYKFVNYINGISADDLPDGIFCFSDQIAYEVLAAVENRGLNNVAVMGFDNIQREINLPGSLVSVSYDKELFAGTAVSMLMNKINGINDGHPGETLIGNLSVAVPELKFKV